MVDRCSFFAASLLIVLFVAPSLAQQSSFRVGDQVSVSATSTKLMGGEEVLGVVPKGTSFRVEKISGAWLQARVTINGKRTAGWIRSTDVAKQTTRPRNISPSGGNNSANLAGKFDPNQVKVGDTVVVAASYGISLRIRGESLKINGKTYKIEQGTRLKVEKITTRFGRGEEIPYFYVTVQAGGQSHGGWITTDHLTSVARYQAGETHINPYAESAEKREKSFRRLVHYYDKKFDRTGTLFGTTPIRQGLTDTITPAIVSAGPIYDTDLTYFSANSGLDPSTARRQQTDQLLESLGDVPPLENLLRDIQQSVDAFEESEEVIKLRKQAADLYISITDLRRNGNYGLALEKATELVDVCVELYGEGAWQKSDAEQLAATLGKIAQLDDNTQQELAAADASTLKVLELLQQMQNKAAMALAQQQYAVRFEHLGENDSETLASLAWIAALGRQHCDADNEVLHHQLLEAFQEKFEEGHPCIARSLSNLAAVRHDRADFEAAIPLTTKALSLRFTSQKTFDPDIALLLIRLSYILEENGQASLATQCSSLARAVGRTLPQAVSGQIVRTYFHGEAYHEILATSGMPFYLIGGLAFRPSEIVTNMYGGDTVYKNDLVNNSKSDFNALTMKRITGPDPLGNEAKFPDIPYVQATGTYLVQGDYGSAERFGRKAIEIAERTYANQTEFHWRITAAKSTLARILQFSGDTAQASEVLIEALPMQRRIHATEIAEIKRDIAAGKSMKYRAIAKNGPLVDMLLMLAKIRLNDGDLREAEGAAREAVELAKIPYALIPKKFNRKYSKVPEAKMTLGNVLRKANRPDEAAALYRDVLQADFDDWAFSPWTSTRTHEVLAGLAEILLEEGTPEANAEGRAMAADAFILIARNSMFMHQLSANRQVDLFANVLKQTGRKAEAVRLLEMAIEGVEEFRKQVGGDELNRARFFSELTRTDPYSALVQLQVELGDDFADSFGAQKFGPDVAFDFLERGRGRALLDLLSRGEIDIDEALAELQQQQNDPELTARIAAIREQEAEARQKAAGVTAEMQNLMKDTQKLLSLGADKITTHVKGLQNQIQQALNEERQAQRDLFDIAKTAREESAPDPMTSVQVGQTLADDELLLAYDVSSAGCALLVVRPGGQVDGYQLQWPDETPVTLRVLSASLAEFFEEISRESTEDVDVDESIEIYFPDELRSALVPDDVMAQLKQSSRAFIVADGPLHRLPLEALFLDEAGEKVLVDELPPLIYGPSATVLLSERKAEEVDETPTDVQLVALGDPTFGEPQQAAASGTGATLLNPAESEAVAAVQSRTRSLSSFGELMPLPGTRAEINTIIREVKKSGVEDDAVRVLTGDEATVTNLFQSTSSPRHLHLATHGLAEGGLRAWESSLAMATPDVVTADDNGFLKLGDLLYQWGGKLQGTELVVLSACRTARGELEAGDGFVALTWGFLYAGADNVVASLWEVDDTATALLMSRFYQNMLGTFENPRHVTGTEYAPGEGLPKAVALQEAKRWLRQLSRDEAAEVGRELLGESVAIPTGEKPFAAPFYWAAFLLFGGD